MATEQPFAVFELKEYMDNETEFSKSVGQNRHRQREGRHQTTFVSLASNYLANADRRKPSPRPDSGLLNSRFDRHKGENAAPIGLLRNPPGGRRLSGRLVPGSGFPAQFLHLSSGSTDKKTGPV